MSFEAIKPIGRVMSVDTMRVFIHVDDHEMLKEVMVGNLIAVQGATPHQLLISIVERITRLPVDSLETSAEPDDDSAPQPESLQDTIRAVLVGTYRSKDGDAGPKFKRGADSCPQIDQPCFLIQSAKPHRVHGRSFPRCDIGHSTPPWVLRSRQNSAGYCGR